MILSFKYRLKPSKAQIKELDILLNWHKELYNSALEERIECYKKTNRLVTCFEQASQIKEIRTIIPELKKYSCKAFHETIRRLDKAYKSFFRGGGFPRFKSSKRFNSFSNAYGNGISFDSGNVIIKGIGKIKVIYHRHLPLNSFIKQIIIKRHNDNWYAIFQIEIPDTEPNNDNQQAIGLDLGIASYLTDSNGNKIDNPRISDKNAKKLKRLNRSLSRKKRGSKNYRKASKQLAKLHEHITNQRVDFQHKLSKQIITNNDIIVAEDLSISNMINKDVCNRNINDVSWYRFRLYLKYKSILYGKTYIEVDPNYTSQTCSQCGDIAEKKLNQRIHTCKCGLVLDRDHNAAINILRLGTSLQALTQTNRLNVA